MVHGGQNGALPKLSRYDRAYPGVFVAKIGHTVEHSSFVCTKKKNEKQKNKRFFQVEPYPTHEYPYARFRLEKHPSKTRFCQLPPEKNHYVVNITRTRANPLP